MAIRESGCALVFLCVVWGCNVVWVSGLWDVFGVGFCGLMLLGCFRDASFMLLGRSFVGVL